MKWFRTLRGAGWLFVGARTIHTLDHARRGVDASPEGVTWAGTFVGLLAAVTITLIVVRHRAAPALAAAVMPSIGFGVAVSHLLPHWGPLSDPILFDSATDVWSIPAVTIEIVAAIWLGFVAWRILHANGYSWSICPQRWDVIESPRQTAAGV